MGPGRKRAVGRAEEKIRMVRMVEKTGMVGRVVETEWNEVGMMCMVGMADG